MVFNPIARCRRIRELRLGVSMCVCVFWFGLVLLVAISPEVWNGNVGLARSKVWTIRDGSMSKDSAAVK